MTNVFVQTFGCSANVAEGEIIKGLLNDSNYCVVEAVDSSDVVILNICTVKGNSPALKEIRDVRKNYPDKKLIVAGCIPIDIVPEVRKIAFDASFVNTHNLNKIVEVVEEALSDNPIEVLSKTNLERISLPRIRHNPVVGIIPISNGCDSFCTFCSVKFIKGNTKSYSSDSIINEVKVCVNEGCKEIWLTSQDTGCYGHDIGTSLIDLLKRLVDIDGDFKIRLGMANPKHVRNYYKELAEVFKHDKMFRFLHIPVQSGSDEILSKMKREHSVKDYVDIVSYLKKEIPEIVIATDIICGFPGETQEQFEDTVKLLEITQSDVVNISRFASRERTLASKMLDQVSGLEKKNRSKVLADVFHKISLEQNKKWVGWEGEIVISEISKGGVALGRNYCYKQIGVDGSSNLGDKVKVKITRAGVFELIGQICS